MTGEGCRHHHCKLWCCKDKGRTMVTQHGALDPYHCDPPMRTADQNQARLNRLCGCTCVVVPLVVPPIVQRYIPTWEVNLITKQGRSYTGTLGLQESQCVKSKVEPGRGRGRRWVATWGA